MQTATLKEILMGFRTLFDALKGRPLQHARRSSQRRLKVESLEDRAVPASLSISDVSILEGNAGTRNALVTVSLTGSSNASVSVGYVTASGSAQAGSDYQPVSGTLSFPKGVTSKSILIPIVGDTAIESDETFSINLRSPKKARIADGHGVVTIVNDDTRINIDNVWLAEGNTGTTSFNFPVRLSHAIGQPVTVNYATTDGTAAAGSDYVANSGTLTIPAGQISGTLTVLVNGDQLSESDESFYLNLTNPTNGVIADGQGVGTIVDDEPRISISGPYAAEGNSGTTAFDFTLTLSSTSELPVTVDYNTADGMATSLDGDYEAGSGTLTFAPGVTSQIITVQVNGDATVEPDEDFFVNLSNPTNAQIGYSQGSGTIVSDDNAVLHIDSWYDSEPDPNYGGLTAFYFTVWLSAPSTETVTVDFTTVDGSALGGLDYESTSGQVTFAPGETSQTILVWVLPDYEYEYDEDFYVVLSTLSSNAIMQPGWETGYGTIYDNQGDWWW
jgi:chitinase